MQQKLPGERRDRDGILWVESCRRRSREKAHQRQLAGAHAPTLRGHTLPLEAPFCCAFLSSTFRLQVLFPKLSPKPSTPTPDPKPNLMMVPETAKETGNYLDDSSIWLLKVHLAAGFEVTQMGLRSQKGLIRVLQGILGPRTPMSGLGIKLNSEHRFWA